MQQPRVRWLCPLSSSPPHDYFLLRTSSSMFSLASQHAWTAGSSPRWAEDQITRESVTESGKRPANVPLRLMTATHKRPAPSSPLSKQAKATQKHIGWRKSAAPVACAKDLHDPRSTHSGPPLTVTTVRSPQPPSVPPSNNPGISFRPLRFLHFSFIPHYLDLLLRLAFVRSFVPGLLIPRRP